MKYQNILDSLTDAALSAGLFVRCIGYALVIFIIIAPVLVLVLL
jgi:hypothetical protein